MTSPISPAERYTFLLPAACFVIVVAGMRAAAPLVVPFLLATFIAIICSGPLAWMEKRKIPTSLAILLIVSLVVLVGIFIATFVGASLSAFYENLPTYEERIGLFDTHLLERADHYGIHISPKVLMQYFDPRAVISWVAGILTGFGGMLTNTFMIIMTVVFILFEVASMPDKIRRALPNADNTLVQLTAIMTGVKQYLGLKTVLSLLTGAAVTIWLTLIGIDYPLLWGLVAFALNFIPNIGSIIAAVPAVLLALVQLGFGDALLAASGYLLINMVIGNMLEPKVLGHGMGLSTLVVFVSLVFWGWALGPVGMLLSVPLTMIMRIALDCNPRTRWMAIILGPESAPTPS
jgi:predicted PurR-regulated permease PerM